VTGRNWKRIETELGELLPGVAEAADGATADQGAQTPSRRADEDSILKHIANALQLGKARES
jgi:hypothetical protein